MTRRITLPPGGVWARALSTRLLNNSFNKVGSPRSHTGSSRLQRQGHTPRMGQRRHGHAQLASQLAQVEQLGTAFGNRPGTVLDARQREQLVGQVGQPSVPWAASFQRGCARSAGSSARRPSSNRALSAATGVRNSCAASAMNCAWRSNWPAQAFGEVIQRMYQRPQFVLHLNHRQWPQVVGLTLFHGRAQALQRPQRRR